MQELRIARAEAGMTLMELEAASGVGASTISKIERGVTQPQVGTLRKLAQALGVAVEDFFREPAVPLPEAPREAGPPQVSHEELAELGVTATDAELRELNDTMASLWRLALLGEKAHAFIGQDDVDTNRILMLMHLVLGTPNIVTPEAAGVVRQGMREQLKA